MRGDFEHLHQLAEGNVFLHRDDVGARDHDVLDPALAQAEDVLEHGALFRRKAGLGGGAGFQDHFEVGADRVGLPAQEGAQQAREPGHAALAHDLARTGNRNREIYSFAGRFIATRRIGVGHGGRRHVAMPSFA